MLYALLPMMELCASYCRYPRFEMSQHICDRPSCLQGLHCVLSSVSSVLVFASLLSVYFAGARWVGEETSLCDDHPAPNPPNPDSKER